MSTEGKQHLQEPMLVSLFDTMSSHNVEYCVLHSTDSLPFSLESDLDLAINNMDLNTIEDILYGAVTRINWVICQKLWYDVPYCVYYVVRSRDNNAWAALDFMLDEKGIGRYGFPVNSLANQRISNNGFYQTNPSVEFCYKVVKRIRKGELKSGDASTLNRLLESSDKIFTESLLKKHLGKFYAKKIIHIFSTPNGSINTGHLRSMLLMSNIVQRRLRHPMLFLERILMQCMRILSRIYHPTGIILTIPKSYALSDNEIEKIIKSLSPAFRRVKKNVRSTMGMAKALSSASLVLNLDEDKISHAAIKENIFKKSYFVMTDNLNNREALCENISKAALILLEKRMRNIGNGKR